MANPNPPSFADIVKRMESHVDTLKAHQSRIANHEASLGSVVVGLMQRLDTIEMLMSGQINLRQAEERDAPPEPQPALPPSGVSSAVGLASPVGANRPALDELNSMRPNLVR